MPQRVTKTDEAYVHKQLKRPHDASGDIFEIRRIVLNNLGHKAIYLMYGVNSPPPFDDVDDEWDETSGAEQDYITAGLYLKADDAKKAVAAYEKEKEKEARARARSTPAQKRHFGGLITLDYVLRKGAQSNW